MDPTIRKKRRSEHPLNVILGKRLELIRAKKDKDKHLPVHCTLSDSESENDNDDDDNVNSSGNKKASSTNVSTELNLSISSDSSLEEGEVPDPEIIPVNDNSSNNKPIVPIDDHSSDTDSVNSMNSRDLYNSDINVKPSTSGCNITCYNSKAKPSVNFNLEANKICEYVPESPIRRDIPVYNPSPIVKPERSSVSGIPRKDILFDLWLIIRKIDQDIGKDLEASMIRKGFLRARYPR